MRRTISAIVNAIKQGKIDPHQITSAVFKDLGIRKSSANTYLSMHSKPSKYQEYFVRLDKGIYEINEDNQDIKSILQD